MNSRPLEELIKDLSADLREEVRKLAEALIESKLAQSRNVFGWIGPAA